MRLHFPVVRKYLIFDVFLSSLGLILAFLMPKYIVPSIFEDLLKLSSAHLISSYLIYPVFYVMLGFTWPKIAQMSISIGRDNQDRFTLSFNRFRDFILGNNESTALNHALNDAVDNYLDRVMNEIQQDFGAYEEFIIDTLGLSPADLQQDKTELLERIRQILDEKAAENFFQLYQDVSKFKNIPLMERNKPLMKIPEMNREDEERLYQQGIQGLFQLIFIKVNQIQDIPVARAKLIKYNAKRLLLRRVKWTIFSFVGIAGMVLLGYFFTQLISDPIPRASTQQMSSPTDVENYEYPELEDLSAKKIP